MRILSLLTTTTISLAALIDRQVTIAPSSSASLPSGLTLTTVTTSIFPGGVATSNTSFTSTIPLACSDGCWDFAGPYGFCFIFDTLPTGQPVNRTGCPQLCTQAYYDGLSACLNCIVANGNEVSRPLPTSTSTRSTSSGASASSSSTRPISGGLLNPFGSIDANQGNVWLRNLTSYCSAAERSNVTSLTGATTVTASPTTTGPYYLSWTSGQTITRPIWTGLSQYSPPVATYIFTVPADRQSGAVSGGGSSSSSNQAAAGASSSRAAGIGKVQASSWIWGGAILAWAVL